MKRNKFRLLIALLTLATAMTACKDMRDNFMVDDTFGFPRTDPSLTSAMLLEEKYELGIIKSGKGYSAATVALTVSEVALAEYNEVNGTDYVQLPADYYEFSSDRITFSKEENRKFLEITWDAAEVLALGDDKDYVIPLSLTAVDNALPVDKERNATIIALKRSYVSLALKSSDPLSPTASREPVVLEGSIGIDNPVKTMDITVDLAVDNTFVDAYNEDYGTDYDVAPEGLISIDVSSTIAAGESSVEFEYSLNSAVLFEDNELKEAYANDFLIPIRIATLSSNAVGLINDVVYVTVDVNKELKGPWEILEGAELCLANDPVPEPYDVSQYSASKLFNGKYGAESEVWASYFNTKNQFPITFVADMGAVHVFTKFRIADAGSYQGQLRNYKIYTAETYDGANTEWNLVAEGLRDYGWIDGGGVYDYPVQNMIPGRYLKFTILNHQLPESNWAGDYINGRCKLAEVFGMGF